MLASRHHSSRTKSCQLSRATSTLKHSSNQKGFRARNRKRNTQAAAASRATVSTETHVQPDCPDEVWGGSPGLWLTTVSGCCIVCVGANARIPDDNMLRTDRN